MVGEKVKLWEAQLNWDSICGATRSLFMVLLTQAITAK